FLALLRRYLDRRGLGIEWDAVAAAPAPALINSLSMALPFEPAEKQALLEAAGLHERREALGTLLEIGAIRSSEDDDEPPPVH
ncbi:MAG: LON peptidase substrate-binding domain-containing protein, partial [Caulobacteraceae bacterium]